MANTPSDSVLSLVLAGGVGKRLNPLTVDRTKPSVPFGGKYRIIDFALSNLINSGIYSIYVLVQYKSQSLIEHIRTSWRGAGFLPSHFITAVPPQMRRHDVQEWYRGTADSIYQNINLIYDFKPKLVAIFAGDHIYRMNIKDMIDYHHRKRAKLTIAVIPIEAKQASEFGIVDVNDDFAVEAFREKPTLEGSDVLFASMGNYIFDTDFLIEMLEADAGAISSHDFGKDIIPSIINNNLGEVYAYDFSRNRIPALRKYEAPYYWRDVGTIPAYWQAHMDLLGKEPVINFDNHEWPIYGSNFNLGTTYIGNAQIENSRIGDGTKIRGAKIKNSIIGSGVEIKDGSVIEDSIVMDFTQIKRNVKLHKVIIDRFNIIPEGTVVDESHDIPGLFRDPSGIAVIRRGARKKEFLHY
ncbi:MAG: glucose-1-phosphate adenylyltransferase [Candidatus Omnitrophica bacterium]|nr:glucose-1-phosphate adenylyltransferase [Candidatus Omnitrophota bacterium]MDD5081539.1 glucose-1-phosphate adenylyltransferase [Candidatus Omnitrophota bacterium]MDD5440968.1 glucose-1-phosphate adenylyltransferase [Candidatus Omnitrophota bacterium]